MFYLFICWHTPNPATVGSARRTPRKETRRKGQKREKNEENMDRGKERNLASLTMANDALIEVEEHNGRYKE